MKNFFKGLGKGILYLLLYLGVSIFVELIFTIIIFAVELPKILISTENGADVDMVAITESLTNAVLKQALLITVIAGIVTLGILFLVFKLRKKKFFQEFSLRKIKGSAIVPILFFGVGLQLAIGFIWSVIPFPENWTETYADRASLISEGNIVIALIATIIMAPLVEEIIFRGLIYTRMKKGMNLIVAGLLSSLLFGIVHGTLIWASYAFVLGMILVWLFERYQSLLATILLHFIFNAGGMILGYFEEMPDLLFIAISIIGIVLVFIGGVWINLSTKKSVGSVFL